MLKIRDKERSHSKNKRHQTSLTNSRIKHQYLGKFRYFNSIRDFVLIDPIIEKYFKQVKEEQRWRQMAIESSMEDVSKDEDISFSYI